MPQSVRTRSQRRMERKQALLLLGVLLLASLVCFSLGVMVGRSASEPPTISHTTVKLPSPEAERLEPAPVVKPVSPPAVTGVAVKSDPKAVQSAEQLTFYQTLPKGDHPLGSGINLPPENSPSETESEALPSEAITPVAKSQHSDPIVVGRSSVEKPPQVGPAKRVVASGVYALQVASFKQPEAAGALQAKLLKKGYPGFVKSADLGAKGIWHRVFCGPFPDRAATVAVQRQLKAEEKIDGLIRKH